MTPREPSASSPTRQSDTHDTTPSPGIVAAAASRAVLAVGPDVASLAEPCLAVAREGVLLAFACPDLKAEADAAWRLAARLAGQGAVALPLWPVKDVLAEDPNDTPAAATANDALVTRVIEDFGRLDGVLAVVDGSACSARAPGEGEVAQAFQPVKNDGQAGMPAPQHPADDAVANLLRAAARRLGRGEPRVRGQFVVVWHGDSEGLVRLRETLAARAADGSCPGAGRYWEMHVTPAPANPAESAARGQEWAGWLCPARTAASVPDKPSGKKP